MPINLSEVLSAIVQVYFLKFSNIIEIIIKVIKKEYYIRRDRTVNIYLFILLYKKG